MNKKIMAMSEFLKQLAGKRPVQIAALSFEVCCTVWFIFFNYGRRVLILMTFLFGVFFSNEVSKLQDSENPRYVKFNRVFGWSAFIMIVLPSILGLLLLAAFGIDVIPQYGSSVSLICTTGLARRLLSLLLFSGPDSAGEPAGGAEFP